MPPHVTANTGLDALVHAIESYVSATSTPFSDILAYTAIGLIAHNLPLAYSKGNNSIARYNMLLAASLAGLVFASSRLGIVHGLAYVIDTEYHLPHGRANAIMLPHVMEFNKTGNLPKFAKIAEAMGKKIDDCSFGREGQSTPEARLHEKETNSGPFSCSNIFMEKSIFLEKKFSLIFCLIRRSDMPNISFFHCPTKIYMGINAHRNLQSLIREGKINKLFLLVDPAILKTELFSSVEEILKKNNLLYEIYSDIEPDPSSTVEEAYEAYKELEAPALLAIGGGSTIDAGKAVGILATNGGRIQQYEGIEKFSNPPSPLVAIPKTAGTGSEVSGSCVITDSESGLKMSIRHASLNPARVAILDPIAFKSLPASVAAHAAMDAFVHAFESYISLNAQLMTDGLNLFALELIAHNVRQFVANRTNLEAGLNMAAAATLAGITFGLTGLGNVHCMARFVGAFFHVSHGLSNAICLPYVAEFNLIANPKKYARVAKAMGESIEGLTELEAAQKAVEAIKRLCQDLGIPRQLREINAAEEKIPKMAKLCVEANYNRWNPRHSTYEDFLNLFKKAF